MVKDRPEPKLYKGFIPVWGIMIHCKNCNQRSHFNDAIYWRNSVDNGSSDVFCSRCMEEGVGEPKAKEKA